jgi:hypothetical protein
MSISRAGSGGAGPWEGGAGPWEGGAGPWEGGAGPWEGAPGTERRRFGGRNRTGACRLVRTSRMLG